eukprot:6145806-Prymnesium_polylepis.1
MKSPEEIVAVLARLPKDTQVRFDESAEEGRTRRKLAVAEAKEQVRRKQAEATRRLRNDSVEPIATSMPPVEKK